MTTGAGGGGVGVRRLFGAGGDGECFNFGVDSFGSDAARVFVGGNLVVITTGLVVLFERDVGIVGGLGVLLDGGGLLVILKKIIFYHREIEIQTDLNVLVWFFRFFIIISSYDCWWWRWWWWCSFST